MLSFITSNSNSAIINLPKKYVKLYVIYVVGLLSIFFVGLGGRYDLLIIWV
jgi:hypothetical protein